MELIDKSHSRINDSCSGGGSEDLAQVAATPEVKPAKPEKAISEGELMKRMERAGLTVESLDLARLHAEPRSTFSAKVSDGQGNMTPMTLVQLKNSADARMIDKQRINGFAARNWFSRVTISNYFKDRIETALS